MVRNEKIIVQSAKGSKKIGNGRQAFYPDMENKFVAEFKQIRAWGLKKCIWNLFPRYGQLKLQWCKNWHLCSQSEEYLPLYGICHGFLNTSACAPLNIKMGAYAYSPDSIVFHFLRHRRWAEVFTAVLFVCLWAGCLKKLWTDSDETWCKGWVYDEDKLIWLSFFFF